MALPLAYFLACHFRAHAAVLFADTVVSALILVCRPSLCVASKLMKILVYLSLRYRTLHHPNCSEALLLSICLPNFLSANLVLVPYSVCTSHPILPVYYQR